MSHITSVAIFGLESEPVTVEADITFGLPAFHIVGLPDAAVNESKERIRSALKNAGLPFSRYRVTVNLAPAHVKKQGPIYDLPIALAILCAQGDLPPEATEGSVFAGELGLHGEVRGIQGALLLSLMTKERGFRRVFVPCDNIREATLIAGIEVYGVSALQDIVAHLNGGARIEPAKRSAKRRSETIVHPVDFRDVQGQEHAKRGMEIAAAGGHNVLLCGPPGSGKTLISRAMPSILPDVTEEEALEITKIYSVAGELSGRGLIETRPFRSPHHSCSSVALVGGGTWPRPGEISLAHRGVLFLDEFPEFGRSSLENLRQPLEDGVVTVSRASATLRFPAKFMLVAAMNPCPCGYATDPNLPCTCTPSRLASYQKKLSGPLLDRIDLHIPMPKVETEKLLGEPSGESSEDIRARVQAARRIEEKRFKKTAVLTNAEMSARQVRQHCDLDPTCRGIMRQALQRLHLSARAYTRILKIARTIADLETCETIETKHLTEALTFRQQTSTALT